MSSQPSCEEDVVGISTLTVHMAFLHLSASLSKTPGLRRESLTKVVPNPGVASTSPGW